MRGAAGPGQDAGGGCAARPSAEATEAEEEAAAEAAGAGAWAEGVE